MLDQILRSSCKYVSKSRQLVVVTGASISTNAGIPVVAHFLSLRKAHRVKTSAPKMVVQHGQFMSTGPQIEDQGPTLLIRNVARAELRVSIYLYRGPTTTSSLAVLDRPHLVLALLDPVVD